MGAVPHFEVGFWIRIEDFDRIMAEKEITEMSYHSFCYVVKRRNRGSVSLYQENHISCKEDDGASGEQAVI